MLSTRTGHRTANHDHVFANRLNGLRQKLMVSPEPVQDIAEYRRI